MTEEKLDLIELDELDLESVSGGDDRGALIDPNG
jgi:hypothetical protein